MLLWDLPITPRDRSHALGPGPGEYYSYVIPKKVGKKDKVKWMEVNWYRNGVLKKFHN